MITPASVGYIFSDFFSGGRGTGPFTCLVLLNVISEAVLNFVNFPPTLSMLPHDSGVGTHCTLWGPPVLEVGVVFLVIITICVSESEHLICNQKHNNHIMQYRVLETAYIL